MFGGQSTGTGLFGGAQKPSIFGQSSAQPSGGLFGQPTSTAAVSSGTSFFGQTQQQKPLFANTATTQSSIFGAQPAAQPVSTGLFGAQTQQPTQTSLFGTSAANNAAKPAFGFNATTTPAFGATGTGTTVKFVPITATDTMLKNGVTNNINTRNMCITAMKQYEGKSLEELRMEDYAAGRKSGQSNALFGQQTSQVGQSGGIFGNTAQNKPAGGLFSITPGFGAFTNNNFSSATGTAGQATGTGLFGGAQKPSIFGQSSAQPSGGLFGQPTSTAAVSSGTSFFGQTQQQKPLFANTATTQSSIFGAQPAAQPVSTGLFGAQTQQPTQTSLFGTSAANNAAKPAFGFNATTTPAFGGAQSAFGSDASKIGQGTGIFGTTSTAGQTGGIFGGLSNANQGGGLFAAANAQKPGSTLFGLPAAGNQQQPGMFTTPQVGNTGNVSLPVGASSISLGSRAQQEIIDAQLAALPYGDSPLLKTSNKTATTTEDSLLQLPSHTAGGLQRQLRFLATKLESPLSTSTVTSSLNGASILSTSAALNSSTVSLSSTSNRLPVAGSDLNTSALMNGSFSYKPLISLPSVGFGAALGLSSPSSYMNSPNGHSLKNRSFLAQDSREIDRGNNSGPGANSTDSPKRALTGRKAKALDISVIHNPSPSQAGIRTSVGNDNKSELQTPLTRKETSNKVEEDIIVPKFPNIDSVNSPSITDNSCVSNDKFSAPPTSAEHRQVTNSPQSNNTFDVTQNSQQNNSTAVFSSNSLSPVTSPNTRKSEYYTKPTVDELLPTETSRGTFRVDSGLTIGRHGCGSVFWPGPFELKELNFDEIVRFRTKEVVVYPDESKKPPVGEGLNRPAEVCLERVWPVGKSKEPIKSPHDLGRLQFSEKLKKLCERMDAEFRGYDPASGTWHFSVQHFSKYGYYDDDDDTVLEQLPTEEELELSRKQQQMQLSANHGKTTKIKFSQADFQGDSNITPRTRQVSSSGVMYNDGKDSRQTYQNNKTISIFDNISLNSIENQNSPQYHSGDRLQDVLNKLKSEMIDDDYEKSDAKPKKSLFTEQHVPTKRVKFDDLVIRSRKLLKDVSMRDPDAKHLVPPPVPVLVERSVVNVFKGITREMLENSVVAMCSTNCKGLLRSCRVGFGQNTTFLTTLIPGEYSTTINISNITTVVCFEEYLKRFLTTKSRLSELADLKRTELLRWDPPSTLLKLIDSYVVKLAQANDQHGDEKLWSLCESLILPPSPLKEINQRVLFGNWLRKMLMPEMHNLTTDTEAKNESKFYQIYQFLVNGAVCRAAECARNARLYDLAMLISMFIVPPGTAIQGQLAEQLNAHRRMTTFNAKKDIYYERILELFSGSWRPSQGAEKESWMQSIGVIVWYFAKPSTTLSECVQLYEQKFK